MKRGITLIALVVTIVVLLILAGVTILLTVGSGGIIERVQNSKLDSRYGTLMDKIKVREMDIEIALERGEERENQQDFINRLITEGLITSDDEYGGDYSTIYLGKQSDGTFKYTIDVADGRTNSEKIADAINSLPDADAPGNEHLKNMTLIIEITAANQTINLPISRTDGLMINWDATNITSSFEYPNTTMYPTHTYPQIGTYEVQLQGELTTSSSLLKRVYYEDYSYIIGIKHWGENGFTNINSFSDNLQGEIPVPSRNSFKKVTNFARVFEDCYDLTGSIPEGLFANCPNVTNFSGTFSGCYGLTGGIPEGLFANCPEVTTFNATFYCCSGLTSIPETLFSNCLDVTTFRLAFLGCVNLTGNAPVLWERIPEPNGSSCFYYCLNLTNYEVIPGNWKNDGIS